MVALFLSRKNCNVVTTIIKLAITLILFYPLLTAVAGVKNIVEYLTNIHLARAIIPLSIYILFYIINPKADN